jgi:hypothetical protein
MFTESHRMRVKKNDEETWNQPDRQSTYIMQSDFWLMTFIIHSRSVADPNPGSGAF